jgi:hypothetical protein
MTIKYKFIALLFAVSPAIAFAQKDKNDGNLKTESVEIIKNFDARLIETEKQKLPPALPAIDTATSRLTYQIPAKTLNVDYQAPKIRPLAIKPDKDKDNRYNGYLKAGYGIPSSPYVEFGYGMLIDKQLDAAIHVKHHSANFKSLENQRFANSGLLLNGTYYGLKQAAINAKVGYNLNDVYFYGYDHAKETHSADEVRNRVGIFDFGVNAFNSKSDTKGFNWNAGVNFYNMKDSYPATENGVDVRLGATKWFADKHPFTINLRTDFTNFHDRADQSLNNLYLQPSFTFVGDSYKVKLGANLVSTNDVIKYYPDIEAAAQIAGDRFTVFAGWKGDAQKNTFRSLQAYCPFIASTIQLKNTEYQNFYGGIKGKIRFLDYQLQASYKPTTNLALYNNSATDAKRFDVVYDSTVNIVNLQAVLRANPIKGLALTGTISNNVFTTSEAKAWHLPHLEANFTAKYTAFDQLRVRGELYIADGIQYQKTKNVADRLNPLLDVSVGAEYQVVKNVGIFLDVNNLLNNKRQRWNGYSTYGLNILGGVTARF